MSVIYKYDLTNALYPETYIVLPLPRGALVLHAAVQADRICVWAEVDLDVDTEAREFEIHATGRSFDGTEPRVYIDTVHVGPFVWHVYERL